MDAKTTLCVLQLDYTVVWAQSLYMQETSVNRERATGPRDSLDS